MSAQARAALKLSGLDDQGGGAKLRNAASRARVYCYPRLDRAGLGNCLLVWARAVTFARAHALPLLAPRWVQPRLGAYLRGERVKRLYWNEFTGKGYVTRFRRALILATFPRKSEEEASATVAAGARAVIVFEGLRKYFADIRSHREQVRQELFEIVSPLILEKLEPFPEGFIGMHIRRGDIMTPGLTQEQLLAKKHYTPLGWFIAGALAARADPHWRRLPVCVLSDGREPELAALLRVPNCRLVTRGTAIGDLLFLAKAKLLFGTGHSTFSMWASHLGAMPTVYAAGKLDQRVFAPEDGVIEGEWAPGQPLPHPPC